MVILPASPNGRESPVSLDGNNHVAKLTLCVVNDAFRWYNSQSIELARFINMSPAQRKRAEEK
jgi:hypothetical protein